MTRSCSSFSVRLLVAALVVWTVGCSGNTASHANAGGAAGSDAGTSGAAGTPAVGGASGSAAGGAGGAVVFPTTCDDIGTEPTIPPPCATIVATKTVTVPPTGAGGGAGAGGVSAGGASAGGAPGGAAGAGGSSIAGAGGSSAGAAGAGGSNSGGAGGATTAPTLSVLISDEAELDTDRIQAAIDACPAGQSVRLVTDGDKVAFVSGSLFLKAGVTLWVDSGVTVYASRNPRDFDRSPGVCAHINASNEACRALVNADGVDGTGVMGEGTLDGRGGDSVIGEAVTWWQLEEVQSGNLAAPRLVQTNDAHDFTLYALTLKNAPKFHVGIETTDGFVVWGITIDTPPDSPNTDGVDPYGSKNGVFAYNTISTGDDNIAIKGSGPLTENLVIAHNHFGRGHGMSIGSETFGGVQNVRVCDLSLDGTDNGLRIKSDSSRGGVVRGISYTDVCIRGVRRPIVVDPFYSTSTGTQIPNFQDILMRNVHVLNAGETTARRVRLKGYDETRPLTVTLDNVVFDDPANITMDSSNAIVTLGPNPVNITPITPASVNVTVTDQVTGDAAPRDCTNAWEGF